MTGSFLKVGLLTISDRAYKGEYEDQSGVAMKKWLQTALLGDFEILQKILPDEQKQIEQTLSLWADEEKCHLVLTSGGTGPAPRDITPEATLAIADKIMSGFGEQMRAISLKYVPTAILSRQVAVIRKKCLIVNLPGRPRSINETLDNLFKAIPYCLELIGAPRIQTNESVVKAYFPPNN